MIITSNTRYYCISKYIINNNFLSISNFAQDLELSRKLYDGADFVTTRNRGQKFSTRGVESTVINVQMQIFFESNDEEGEKILRNVGLWSYLVREKINWQRLHFRLPGSVAGAKRAVCPRGIYTTSS